VRTSWRRRVKGGRCRSQQSEAVSEIGKEVRDHPGEGRPKGSIRRLGRTEKQDGAEGKKETKRDLTNARPTRKAGRGGNLYPWKETDYTNRQAMQIILKKKRTACSPGIRRKEGLGPYTEE